MRNPLTPEWLETPASLSHLDPRIWPRTAKRNERGELLVGGQTASDLVRQFGSPLYVVDQEDFESRLMSTRRAFSDAAQKIGTTAKCYYASKALLTTELVRWVDQAGLSIDVSTSGELAVALAAGIEGPRIGLHGNNKSLVEIGRAISAGVGAIVIDSELEIERIASVASAQDKVQAVRLRVNTGVHAFTHEYLATAREDQKFGIALVDVPDMVEKIRSHSQLKFLGLHSHIGSQIFVVDGFVAAAERLLDVHAKLLTGGDVPELNLGGGFGISYTLADRPLPLDEMAGRITTAVAQKCEQLGIPVPALAFEPGRVIAGPAGVTIYSVGTLKDVQVTDQGAAATRKYVSVDGGMSDNIRPALYEAEYSATIASRSSDAEATLSRVVGKHCESGDIVVRHALLPADVSVNDLLAVPATGAYCFSLSSNYNYLPRPAVIAVKGGTAKVLIRAETERDLLNRDAGFEPGEA
ncbi:MAG TPA: diaminopimelate decarboxylase [Candidatus Aquiluna sp.]|jgi:diaminopimelate decarboxylase|uniref:diaminopimelate decarboxylase n=1 Tax=Aquiluna sp. TaxID=2053504 RepID=UPI00071345EC|nr:MAG: diaminopimelate decarboxylase [Microbacteriaceae bacterium BACL28 MAG-120531-bin53]HAE74430.1 diaminopimelate decarboxylase [Aquiluna sp.]